MTIYLETWEVALLCLMPLISVIPVIIIDVIYN